MAQAVEPATAPWRGDWQTRIKNALMSPWTIVVAVFLGVFLLDGANTGPVAHLAFAAFAGTLPYVVFATLLIAWLKAAGAEAAIGRAFEGRETTMIVLAALFGGLAPFCSCQVLPFVAGLLAVGVPLPAIMAFWLSSPLIDPPTVLITAAALGWSFAIGKVLAAVGLGLFGGLAMKAFTTAGFFANPGRGIAARTCGCGPSPFSGRPAWQFWREEQRRATFRDQLIENALFLVKWLALAYVLEALLITYVPASLIAVAVGGEGIGPIALAAMIGMPAYLNSYVAPPLVAGLMTQGMSPGAGMAFMVGGAVSSIPAMAAVWALVRREVFAAYLGLGLLGAVLAGLLFQLAF
ncbi:MAG: permease [Nitratireductor sp.]|nr:permease [Nitratireductor sp.]